MMTGLVTLADTPNGTTPVPKTLYVQDARNVTAMMPHTPIVMVSTEYKRTFPTGALSTSGDAEYIVLQNAEALTFTPTMRDKLTYTEAPPSSICPSAAEEQSLYFLPRLSRVGRNSDGSRIYASDLKPDHFPAPQPSAVAATMLIDFGKLWANVPNKAVWRFEDSPTGNATNLQMIADEIFWTFTIPHDELTLADGKNPILTVQSNGWDRIYITVANAPNQLGAGHTGISALAGDQTSVTVAKEKIDSHFGLFYDYVQNAKIYRPEAVGACTADGLYTTDQCLMSQYVKIVPPPVCPSATANILVGGLNCGPDTIP